MTLLKELSSIQKMPVTGKTVFVLAHPDDETVVGAGYLGKLGILSKLNAINLLSKRVGISQMLGLSILLSRLKMVKTPTIYYATLGEKGNTNFVCGKKELKSVRRYELQEVTRILGADVTIGQDTDRKLVDGGLKNRKKKLMNSILRFLEEEKPDRVVTFPPSGITLHQDHIAVSEATTEAVLAYNQRHAAKPIALFYRVIGRHEKGITGPYIYHDDLPITHRSKVSRLLFSKRKIADVIRAHRTQVPEMGTIYPAFSRYAKKPLIPPRYRADISLIWDEENFHQRI